MKILTSARRTSANAPPSRNAPTWKGRSAARARILTTTAQQMALAEQFAVSLIRFDVWTKHFYESVLLRKYLSRLVR